MIGEGDGDGWLRARNYRGEEGYVPHNYLDIEQDAAGNGSAANQLRSQISFSSVDYTVDNEDQTVDSMQSPDQVSVIMAPQKKKSDIMYCIALYDYDATAEDELTFEEGQIIKIVTKTAHGVDDGWWEGELDGKFGNFPSLVVEECDENGEPLTEGAEDSPPPTAPPSFALPPAPALPPEYAHELTEDMFGSQDTAGEWKYSIDLECFRSYSFLNDLQMMIAVIYPMVLHPVCLLQVIAFCRLVYSRICVFFMSLSHYTFRLLKPYSLS